MNANEKNKIVWTLLRVSVSAVNCERLSGINGLLYTVEKGVVESAREKMLVPKPLIGSKTYDFREGELVEREREIEIEIEIERVKGRRKKKID